MTDYPTEERYIIDHCSATRPDQDISAADIRRWHKRRDWRDIGYHGVIRRNGDFEFGREMPGYGAHATGSTPYGPMNKVGIGLCMVGGLDPEGRPSGAYFTDRQWDRWISVHKEWMEEHAIPAARALGHRDVINNPVFESRDLPKACPCFDVQDKLREFGLVDDTPKPVLVSASEAPITLPLKHLVDAGDTFWGISRTYGVSLDLLARLNNRFPHLRPGDEIRLR